VNPRIHGVEGNEKLAILPDEVDNGRPVGPQYWERSVKLNFMDRHRIDASIVSIANPWLDFLPAQEAIEAARLANEDLEEWCKPSKNELDSFSTNDSNIPSSSVFSAGDARHSFKCPLSPLDRIRGFGILPFSQDVPCSELTSSLQHISKSKYLKGAIIGTRGKGKGLDDPDLEPLWKCAEEIKQPLFLHPHYGVGSDSVNADGLFGTRNNGHVLPLALGFPFETASVSIIPLRCFILVRYTYSLPFHSITRLLLD
jgi:aminocarboxymuconate-semialdehyde decarboxylase